MLDFQKAQLNIIRLTIFESDLNTKKTHLNFQDLVYFALRISKLVRLQKLEEPFLTEKYFMISTLSKERTNLRIKDFVQV